MTFKNKKELLAFVKKQTNVELENDKNNCLNSNRNVLHTEISRDVRYKVLSLFNKYNIRYNKSKCI